MPLLGCGSFGISLGDAKNQPIKNRWINADDSAYCEEFLKYYKKAELKNREFWERKGIELVNGATGNAAVWIFNMKNRFNWRDKTEVDQKGDVKISVIERVIVDKNEEERRT